MPIVLLYTISYFPLQKLGQWHKIDKEEEATEPDRKQSVAENLASYDWYSTIINFLLKLEIPLGFTQIQARTIKLRAVKYYINENLLYWRDPSGVLLRCLDKE